MGWGLVTADGGSEVLQLARDATDPTLPWPCPLPSPARAWRGLLHSRRHRRCVHRDQTADMDCKVAFPLEDSSCTGEPLVAARKPTDRVLAGQLAERVDGMCEARVDSYAKTVCVERLAVIEERSEHRHRPLALHRQREARANPLAVGEHRAGTAPALVPLRPRYPRSASSGLTCGGSFSVFADALSRSSKSTVSSNSPVGLAPSGSPSGTYDRTRGLRPAG